MHTKSSKAVLAPLADAVSALILILAESELSGSPTPDLSSLSQSVATQITNLNGVVQKIIGSSQDEELKNLMPDGCEQVKKASELLLAGAAELTKNNTSSSGRQQLLEAVKNLLSGTTFILDVYDDSEVRKILIASALVRDCCNELHNKPDANEEQYDLWITKLHVLGQAIIPLAQLATKRIADLVMDTLASQLEKAISQLTRSAPNMASAATIFLLDVENQDHAQTLNFFLTTISDASLEIDAIIQCKGDPAQTLPQCGEHERMLEQHRIHSEAIIDKCKRGEILPADKTTETEFFALSENLLHGYKSTSKFVKNSALESTASRLIESGRQDLSQIEKILDDHEIGVTDPRIGHACKESVYALQAQISSLGSMIPPLVISELLPSLANLVAIDHPNTVSFNLREHALQGHELYGDSLDQFSKETSNVKTVADYLLSTLKPEQSVLYCKVDAESKKLASFADAVGCAARIAFANPKEEAAVSNLNNSFSAFINQAKDLEKTLYEQVFSDKDLIDGASTIRS